jgi:glycosyltransferase involved in cell wall biosynthesis
MVTRLTTSTNRSTAAYPDGPVPVSILIPTKNEAQNIEACIATVRWAGEIVVFDSCSIDGTQDIARRSGAIVETFKYAPGEPKKKNWALTHYPFRHDWILILDADEHIPPALAREIDDVVSSSRPEVGYYINRRFYFLGRWIRHAGYYPSWNLRLLRRGAGLYESIPDHEGVAGDNEVHEHILLKGRAGHLKEAMDHYAFPSVYTFVEKHNRYSSWEASVAHTYLNSVVAGNEMAMSLRARRTAKRFARYMPFPDVTRFVFHYFIKLGFLDGKEGYLLCRLLAEYEFLISAKRIAAAAKERTK